MRINMIGSFIRNDPFGTEIAFKKGLEDIGVEVITWDPSRQPRLKPTLMIRPDADATIVFKDHGEETYPDLLKVKSLGQVVIEYQPDDIRAPGIFGMMKKMRKYCDYAFSFDDYGAKKAQKEIGYKKAEGLPVTADPDVYYPIDGIKKDLDFVFVGSLSNPQMHKSRRKMIEILENAGLNVHAESTYDIKKINQLYNRAKVVLNHATDVGQSFGSGWGYQCRHFEAGMAGACLLSNRLSSGVDGFLNNYYHFSDEKSLVNSAKRILDKGEWHDTSYLFHKEVKENHNPRVRAHQIVRFIESVK